MWMCDGYFENGRIIKGIRIEDLTNIKFADPNVAKEYFDFNYVKPSFYRKWDYKTRKIEYGIFKQQRASSKKGRVTTVDLNDYNDPWQKLERKIWNKYHFSRSMLKEDKDEKDGCLLDSSVMDSVYDLDIDDFDYQDVGRLGDYLDDFREVVAD